MDAVGFDPTWLYRQDGHRVLVESQEVYDALMAEGGWAQTPAAFGIITAPNREQQILLGIVTEVPLGPVAPAPMVPADPGLEARVQWLEGALKAVQGLVDALLARCEALEGLREEVVALQELQTQPPAQAEPTSRRRPPAEEKP